MRVGLRRGRGIGRHGCTQIAEPRHRYHPDTALRQWSGESHALVVTTAAAVAGKQRNASTSLLILDRAAGGLDQNAAITGAGVCALHFGVELAPDKDDGCGKTECEANEQSVTTKADTEDHGWTRS